MSDGTINQAQADAVESALEEAKPDRPHRGHRVVKHFAMETVAEALGMTTAELRAELAGETSIADVAADRGVEIQTVVDALVANKKTHLDARVAAGDLTEEEADEKLANFSERVTAFVNGDAPPFRGHRHRPEA